MTTSSVCGASITGAVSTSGLTKEGRITEVTLSSAVWTVLPATPLEDRNSINIQNQSNKEIKVGYDPAETGYVGMIIDAGGERQYNIKDTILIYAKAESGSPVIAVEEIA